MSSGIAMTDVVDATITGNKMSGAYVGISLQGVTGAVIQRNIVSDTDAKISTGRPGYGDTVSGNTVNDALCGIYAPTTPANKFYSVTVRNCYSSGIP
jgi:parallel beta-helix repeat protein